MMIHLNVAFLVIRSTFNTIVKILVNASLLIVNKYTGDGLLRARIITKWQMENTTSTRIIKHVHSIDRRLMSEFSKVSLISVSFVNFTVLVRRRVALHSDCSIDSIEAPYNIYDWRHRITIRKPAY